MVINMDKYYYVVNTFKDDEPVQIQGCIEASSEEEAIQKLIDNGTVCANSYEFLELVKTTDWLTRGVSTERLQKEKKNALKTIARHQKKEKDNYLAEAIKLLAQAIEQVTVNTYVEQGAMAADKVFKILEEVEDRLKHISKPKDD